MAVPGPMKPSPSAFDCRRCICENPGVKFPTLLLVIALAACGKANDVPAIRAEADIMLKNYQAKLDDLSRRADSIMQRGNAIGVTSPDAANASRLFAMAKTKLEGLRADVAASPGEIAKLKTPLEVRQSVGRKANALDTGYREINADFDAVESWITLAESRPTQVSSNQPVVPPPPTSNPQQPQPPATPNQ